MELVDGYYGRSHITADQIGDLNMAVFGTNSYVFEAVGNALSHEIVTNNKVLIKDGAFVHQGRRGLIKAGTTETAIIENGAQNMKRNDLICIRYQKNNSTAVESFTTVVIKGVQGATPTDPTPVAGTIRSGSILCDFPIKRVRLNGLSIEGIDNLFETVAPISTAKEILVNRSGWSAIFATDKLTYKSASAPTFVCNTLNSSNAAKDFRSYLCIGMKLKLTQGAVVKYFFITAIDATSITLYGGTDYTLTNTAITDVCYSVVKSPHGFPLNPNKWSVRVVETVDRNFSLVANTWIATGMQLSVPIGDWIITVKIMPVIQNAGSMYGAVLWCSFSDSEPLSTIPMSGIINSNVASDINMNGSLYFRDVVRADGTRIFKLHCKAIVNATGAISSTGGPTVLLATCAYL